MLRSGQAARAANADQIISALCDWQAGKISCMECARRCRCTFSEWNRIWSYVGRTTPRNLIARRVYRVMRAGKWGGE